MAPLLLLGLARRGPLAFAARGAAGARSSCGVAVAGAARSAGTSLTSPGAAWTPWALRAAWRPQLAGVARTATSQACAAGGHLGGGLARAAGRFAGARWLLAGGAAGWATWAISRPRAPPVACEVKCEVATAALSVAEAPASAPKVRREGPIRSFFGFLSGAFAFSLLVGLWASALAMPFVLLHALATAQWKLAGVLAVYFAWPHVLPVPRIPLLKGLIGSSLRRWYGPPGTVRWVDLSSENDADAEPEPEPTPGASSGKKRKLLYCFHPHGILSTGVMEICANIENLRLISGPFLYHWSPLFRFTLESLMGVKFGSAASRDLHGYMRKGDSPMMIVPGGFHEATITCPGHERVYLKSRKGFVKFALRYGYDLVPVYSCGEADLMANPQGGWGWRFWLNNIGIPAVLPFGFPLFPLFPRRGVELVTGVGPPLRLPHIEKPTSKDVEEHHARYMQAVQRLYDRLVPQTTNSRCRKLEVW